MKNLTLKGFLFFAALNSSCTSIPKNPWSEQTTPFAGDARAVGSTSSGCLSGGISLPPLGEGFQVMRPSRKHYYGHPELIHFLEDMGHTIHKNKLLPLLIGDLSQARGGPMPPGAHRSHQTGIDVDLWYWQPSGPSVLTLEQTENLPAPMLVSSNPQNVEWSSEKTRLLGLVATDSRVDRVFVNPAIKRELCKNAKGAEWLPRIRPWWGHAEHFHVRLKCPKDNPLCVETPPIPAGDGCDATLDWWFTEEAMNPKKAESAAAESGPKVPEACLPLLHE